MNIRNPRPKKYLLLSALLAFFLAGMLPARVLAQSWKLIQPAYPTTDAFVAAFSVADYGATGDGVTDVTSIFQDRLNALGTLGGGTLFVPSGKYVIRGTLLIPKGVTLRGEWQKPVKGQPIVGAILMAYSGRGNESATALITMQMSAAVRDLAIWYPEQLPDNITPYPPAIVFGQPNYFGNDFNNARNITFVNAYDGVKFSTANGGSCPVIFDVYGTPLNKGIEIDNIADVGRLEQIDFSPSYWSGSGLPNAPAAGSAYSTWIYQNGTGIMMRRNDWTNTAFVNIEGYHVGFHAAASQTTTGSVPNGSNHAMNFTNCQTAVYFDASLNGVGIMFSQVTTTNCASGFVLGPNTNNGTVQLHTCSISATSNAISIDSTSTGTFLMEHTTISSGRVNIAGSTFTASDCDFNNGGPQITIGRHARSVLTGNRYKGGTKIQNNSLYVNTIDSLPLSLTQMPSFPTITTETHMPSRLVLYVATSAPYNAKADGATDNTTAIQSALNQASADGGGIVFLPPGKYKVLGDLTVPTNVELKGSADISTAPTGPGSTLEIYADQGNPSGTPFLRLAAGSGIRGLTLDYPQQTGSLVPNFPAYPYAVQALGSNVYIVNIGIRAAYNGIDLFTNKCDNHYVDFLAGQVFHNAVRVGGGSVGGKIYNLHFNTIYYANGSESKFGSWPNSPTNDGDPQVYTYNYNNVNFLEIGNCQGEVLYNDFVYGAIYGLRLLSEGAGPSGTSNGLGIDGARHSMSFEGMGAGGFDFINSQIVSLGDTGNTYIVTNPSFTGHTTFYNADYWGYPSYGISLNGGTISQQTANFNNPGALHWANIQTGSLNLHNSFVWQGSTILNSGAEPHLSARSSIIDSSGIIRANTALWQDNVGISWQVSTAGAMDRHGWTATASLNNGIAQNALDSNASTRWATGTSQAPGQYFIVDMKTVNTFHQIVLDATQSPGDSPVGYGVYVSTDSVNWTGPIASGAGAPGMTLILFSDVVGRYIKIVQTGSQGNWWSIMEFYVWAKVNVTGLSITPKVTSLPVDSSNALTAVISPANATNKAIAWSSNNAAVATVDSTGLVKAVSVGTAIIKAVSLDAGISAYDTITVPQSGAMDRHGWTATASLNNGTAQNALDSNASTRWTTGVGQAPGQYFIVDMKTVNTFHEIALDATQSSGDSPVGYGVYVSTDNATWTGPVASGAGTPGMTLIQFSDQVGRYIKIVQTGSQSPWWSIHEFYVWGKVNVTGLSITPKVTSLTIDSTKRLAALISPANATNKAIAWSSNNSAVVTVDSTGLVKAVSVGTAIIQVVSQDAGISAYDTINVSGSRPFLGTPATIPGKIEAENYDLGGQGVAYSDSDPTNNGGQYRPTEGVDIEACSEGGYDVGWTVAGEWMNYTVNVTTAGVYTLQSRVSSPSTGSRLHVEMDGVNISGSITVPNTGGWQTYQTMSVTTPSLTTGQHIMRIYMETAGFNINYVNFISTGSSASVIRTGSSASAGALSVNNATADMIVYPNPVTGSQINLQFINQPAGRYQLRLINYLNQPVYSTDINISGNKTFYSLSLSRNLLPGTYLLEAINGAGSRIVKKVVITGK